ncbi:hypothetical protein D3C80_2195060 [compost metagenome]
MPCLPASQVPALALKNALSVAMNSSRAALRYLASEVARKAAVRPRMAANCASMD